MEGTIEISTEEYKLLDSLRYEKIANGVSASEIQKTLTHYYPKGTKVIITKDYFEITLE